MKRSLLIAGMMVIAFTWSCTHEAPIPDPGTGDPSDPGLPGTSQVCFESNVLPLFQSYCAKSGCHDPVTHEEGYVLNSYTNIMKKGIVPGNATGSKLYQVLFASGEEHMPPPGYPQLTEDQKKTIGVWINQGAKNTVNCGVVCDENAFAYNANIKPIMTTYCVGCHGSVNPSKGIDLSTHAGVKASALNGRLLGSINHSQGYTPMPQGAAKLSDCQINVIRKWIDAGSQNN